MEKGELLVLSSALEKPVDINIVRGDMCLPGTVGCRFGGRILDANVRHGLTVPSVREGRGTLTMGLGRNAFDMLKRARLGRYGAERPSFQGSTVLAPDQRRVLTEGIEKSLS